MWPDFTNRLINPFMAYKGTSSTNDEMLAFKCPADTGADIGSLGRALKPTAYDAFGTSYLYNSGGNDNDGSIGLYNKKLAQVRNQSRTVLVSDYCFNVWGCNGLPLYFMSWHNRQKGLNSMGKGNVTFVDTHIEFLRPTINLSIDKSYTYDTYRGLYSFRYNDP